MRLLLLNTCGAEASFAFADSELAEPIVVRTKMAGRTASEGMVAALRGAMAEAGWKLRELAAVAVVTGPGSFTGVRVGLSVAKGLSEASGVPLISVSRLAMLASAVGEPGRVCALLDAGRGEFYCGEYQDWMALGEALTTHEDTVSAALKADVVVACEEAVAKALSGVVQMRMVPEPTASDALPFALRRLERGQFDDPMTLDANYLRRTDAEIFAKPAGRAG